MTHEESSLQQDWCRDHYAGEDPGERAEWELEEWEREQVEEEEREEAGERGD